MSNNTMQLNVWIDEELHSKVKLFSAQRGVMLKVFVAEALKKHLEYSQKTVKGPKDDNLID